MDINYYDFIDFWQFPLAEFCREEDIDVLLFPTNWILQDEETTTKKALEIALDLYQWWKLRMTPMIGKSFRLKQTVAPRLEKEWLMVAADRVGKEDQTSYKGCSAALIFNRSSKLDDHYAVAGMVNHKSEACVSTTVTLNR